MNRHVLILLYSLSAVTFVSAQTDTLTSSLLSACQSNNLTAVQESLTQGADINAMDEVGFSPLLYAVTAGNREMTELLLEKGANLNVNDPQGRCPVVIAVQAGKVKILQTLAAAGGDLQHRHVITHGDVQTPLHIAVQNQDIPMVKYLLSEKVSIEARNSDGQSALMLAAGMGNLEMVKLLIENGAYLYADRGFGGSLLDSEIYSPPPLVKRHLQQIEQKRLSAVVEPAWTAFVTQDEFTSSIKLPEVEKYLQEGKNPSGTDKNGRTLLHYAAETRLQSSNLLESLLATPGVDVDAADIHGATALHLACRRDRVENVKMLLEYGASVDVRDYDQKTPLLSLARFYYNHSDDKGEVQIARLLLENGADVNAVDAFGNTPLLCLAEANMDRHLEFTRLLIEHGATLDHQNYNGDTFLHRAAEMGTATMMQLVIEAGANLDIRNYDGKTIAASTRYDSQEKIDLIYTYKQNVSVLEAAYYSQDAILESLIGQGADINLTTNYDNAATALMIAAKRNDPAMVQTVLRLGGSINAQDTLGNTALHYAAQIGHDSVVTLLLSNQADSAIYNKAGWRAVDLAGLENRRRVIQLFRDIYPDITPSREPMLAQQETPADEVVEIISVNGNSDEAMLKKMLMEMSRHIDPNSSEIIVDPNTVEIQITREENNWKMKSYTDMSGSPFHCAVIRGETEKVQAMLKEGRDVHAIDDAGILPLNYAVLMENKAMVDLLLKNGADINRPDENINFGNMVGIMGFGHTVGEKAGWGAIHYATVFGDKEMVDFLISKGADVNLAEIERGHSPIFMAVEVNRPEIIQVLINAGADLGLKNKNGRTILASMAARGKIDSLQLLLELGKVDMQKQGGLLLMTAASMGEDDTMIFLLEQGADINALNNNGKFLRSLVSKPYTTETLKIVIEYGIDVNVKSNDGTPILFGLFSQGYEMKDGLRENIQLLLDAGLDVNATDKEKNSILHHIAKNCYLDPAGSVELAAMMIGLGCDVNLTNSDGETALHIMLNPSVHSCGSKELIRLLAENNTHLNDTDRHGRNTLHNAAILGWADIVTLLASKGADIENWNIDEYSRHTPLHSAIRKKHVDVVRTLLDLGADFEARDKKQQTPLITAAWIDHADIVRVLLAYQADCNAQDEYGKTCLHMAVEKKNKDIIQLLLDAGAQKNIPDRNKRTPLDLAQRLNRPDIADMLQ